MANADTLKLDLDILEPAIGTVTLGGQDYPVRPPSVRNIVKLTKIAKIFDDMSKQTKEGGQPDTQVVTSAIDDLLDVLEPIIPGLKDGKVELTMAQAGALLGYVFQLSAPPETEALAQAGIEPAATEKKIPNGS